MRKRILDTALLFIFCSILMIASNINKVSVCEAVVVKNATLGEKTAAAVPKIISNEKHMAEAKKENASQEAVCIQPITNEINLYTNRWNIYLTSDEIDLLAKIVWVEARGEPAEGQEAVVEVIFNRMSAPQYPDTLYDVLSQDHPVQFCSWKLRDTAAPTEKEYQSIYNVLYGNTNILRSDTVYFSRFQLTPNLDKKICCHCFCYD